MTLTLELSPEIMARVEAAAERKGSPAPQVVQEFIVKHLLPATLGDSNDSTLALFEKWRKEDENMTAEEIAEELQFRIDFRESLNKSRRACGMREI